MNRKLIIFSALDSIVHGFLWAVFCVVIVRHFHLEAWWYVVCLLLLTLEIGLLNIHQRITFPELIAYLGYSENEKLRETLRFKLSDHIINIGIMFLVVYFTIYK
jgi:hypothetical protein